MFPPLFFVVVASFSDDYRSLPRKVVEGICWGIKHTTAEYFIKTDDDAWLQVTDIVNNLPAEPLTKPFIWGGAVRNDGVHRSGKWGQTADGPNGYILDK